MPTDHEGQRVSRRAAIAGVSSVGLSALLAACRGGGDGAVTTSTGSTVTPQATTTTDRSVLSKLSDLFADANTCRLTPESTQGPYYFDADKIRSDIREDRPGTKLRLAIKVQDTESCKPLDNAVVEIWHCDASGLYSGAESMSAGGSGTPGGGGGPGGGPGGDLEPTDDRRYLRGAQVCNSDGIVQFTTVWPGWYRGRTIHIHAMVHSGNNRVLTTQIMFDESLNSQVLVRKPYSQHVGRDTFNDNDNIFEESMLAKVTEEDSEYLGVIVFAADSDKDGR